MKTEFENVYLEYVDELNKKNVKDKMSKEELLKRLEETHKINLSCKCKIVLVYVYKTYLVVFSFFLC